MIYNMSYLSSKNTKIFDLKVILWINVFLKSWYVIIDLNVDLMIELLYKAIDLCKILLFLVKNFSLKCSVFNLYIILW